MRKSPFIPFTLSMTLALSACAPHMEGESQSKNKMSYDQEAAYLSRAEMQQANKPKVVKEYVPVAIPGQLRPTPHVQADTGDADSVFRTKEEAVQYANQNATQTPTSSDFFNAMMTYSYMPGAMYTIYAAPMRITDVMFEPGEKIISQAAGDTLRWQIAQTRSGEGAFMRQHLLVKPTKPNLENTVVVTTNRRVYHLVLQSTSSESYMVSVKWNYEHNMVKQAESYDDTGPGDSGAFASGGGGEYALDLDALSFNYEFGVVKGVKPSWYPDRIFHNEHQTFIAFGPQFSTADVPILFLKNEQGQYGAMVNWRLKGKYMVIDTIVKEARLQSGVESTGETIVQIQLTE